MKISVRLTYYPYWYSGVLRSSNALKQVLESGVRESCFGNSEWAVDCGLCAVAIDVRGVLSIGERRKAKVILYTWTKVDNILYKLHDALVLTYALNNILLEYEYYYVNS